MSPSLHVGAVCTGNICRSPMAEVVLVSLVDRDPALRGRVVVTSAGTANWHVGRPMDTRARAALDRAGLHGEGTPAAYADRAYLNRQDFVMAMTAEHVADVSERCTNPATTVILARDLLDPTRHLDVADPYYGGPADFDACLAMITECCRRWTSEFRRLLGADSTEA